MIAFHTMGSQHCLLSSLLYCIHWMFPKSLFTPWHSIIAMSVTTLPDLLFLFPSMIYTLLTFTLSAARVRRQEFQSVSQSPITFFMMVAHFSSL